MPLPRRVLLTGLLAGAAFSATDSRAQRAPDPLPPMTPDPLAGAAPAPQGHPHGPRQLRPIHPIHTDSQGLIEGAVSIATAGGHIPGYRAMPDKPGPFPVILVVEEIFGVNDYLKDVCRRFAKLGYLAVAPELYARIGDPTTMTDANLLASTIIAKSSDAVLLSDLDSTLAWAAANHGNATKMAVIGFGRGGRDAWLFAEHSKQLKAAISFYGPISRPPTPLQPKNPADLLAELKCPLLGLYAGMDGNIDSGDVVAAAETAKKAGRKVTLVIYGDAPHGFFADDRHSYQPKAAALAWTKTLEFLKSNGVS